MNYETDYSIINTLIDNFQADIKEKYNQYDDIEVYVFPQTWGSTALGYEGIGGSAMTSAQTIVLWAFNENIVRVYFGGQQLAYEIKDPEHVFFEDMYKHQIEGVWKVGKYRR